MNVGLCYLQNPDQIPIVFGMNPKAKLAAKTVFGLAHRHGDILREGWKNILDCMVQLYRARLLPEVLIKVGVPRNVEIMCEMKEYKLHLQPLSFSV